MQTLLGWTVLVLGVAAIVRIFSYRGPKPLNQQFHVEFDDSTVHIRIMSKRDPVQEQFDWSEVTQVCFVAQGFATSDEIQVRTIRNPVGYVIPIEADGGDEFWNEMLRRGLFDQALALEAMGATNKTFCWPL